MEIKLTNLNQAQAAAVTQGDGPLLIVAGAGTGKTTVVAQRIAWLIEQKKLKTDQVLALTFTDKAAGEMEERVDKLLPYGYLDLWISTFHAFAERILKLHALDIGLPTDFKLINQTASWLLIKKNIEKFALDYYKPLGHPTKFIHALIQHFSRCKDEEVYPADYLKYAAELKFDLDNMESSGGQARRKKTPSRSAADFADKEEMLPLAEVARLNEIADAYHVYQQILLDNNSLDFGDLINYTLKLFKTRPQILKKYQQQFQYILVDEFQDTNWAQYELIKLLAKPKNNITVVGDDDQSIYKFRGASVSNILNFKKDFPQAREVFLQTNYRSRQNILDLAYKFIQLNNPDRLEVKLGEKNKLSKKLQAANQGKGIIKWEFADNLEAEVDYVIDNIIKLKEKDKAVDWNDFAILVRANDSANDFISALERRQVPYQFLAARGLYQKPVIRDIVNYLRLLDDYRESPALYRVLSMPIFAISQYQISNLLYWAGRKSWSLFEILRNISAIKSVDANTVRQVNKLTAWIDRHAELAKTKSVWEVIMNFLTDSGYLHYLKGLPPQTAKDTFNQLNQFAKQVVEFEKSFVDNKVSDWLAEFELQLEAGEAGSLQWDIEEGPDSVKLMTMHAAKGLEFEYVFIPNLVDKRFPTIRRGEPIELPEALIKDILPEGDEHLQEERRLFYVAITRAQAGVFFTGAQDYGGARRKKPSQFIYELGLDKEKPKTSVPLPAKELIKQTKPAGPKTTDLDKIGKKYSFTQLKAYQTCPLQYKYAHILRIPVKGKQTFSFGKTMHSTLQKFFELVRSQNQASDDLFNSSAKKKAYSQVTEKDLLQFYQDSWIDDWYESKASRESYRKKGRAALQEFFRIWSKEKIVPEYLEKGFNLKIADYTIRGVIDRIDRLPSKKLEIIDYKTGRSKTKKEIDPSTKRQLLIYQLAAQEVFGEPAEILTFYYLEDNHKLQFIGSEPELDKTRQEIVKIIQQIESKNFEPKPSEQNCRFCDFNKICDFSQFK